MSANVAATAPRQVVHVERWPSEAPLLALVVLASLALWALLGITIVGLLYALLLGLFFFFVHLAFITHLRGSAVRLGPEQLPELHSRVVELARAAGLAEEPEAYLLEAGGNLNALATKFLRGRMIVLFSDLLEACGEDRAARDMVIGHEIGHLRSGHLDWYLLTAPGRLLPFLGSAYSRACERTCDRWGAALCGDAAGAVRGLTILAAGSAHAGRINPRAFAAQQRHLDTGWMTLGRWLSAYPPLSERLALLDPALTVGLPANRRGTRRAVAILAALVLLPALGVVLGGYLWFRALAGLAELGGEGWSARPRITDPEQIEMFRLLVGAHQTEIEQVLREHLAAGGALPDSESELAAIWDGARPDQDFPDDPFTGESYGWISIGSRSGLLYSAGPDGETATADDIDYELDFEGEAGG